MKLLIPLDGSTTSLAAIDHIRLAAQGVSLSVVLVNVQPSLSADITFVAGDMVDEYHQEQSEKAVADALARLNSGTIGFETRFLVGDAAHIIAELANEMACDGIVMGSHGHTGVVGALMGSIATKVVNLANVPVTLVKWLSLSTNECLPKRNLAAQPNSGSQRFE